jgi:hypothetical protein
MKVQFISLQYDDPTGNEDATQVFQNIVLSKSYDVLCYESGHYRLRGETGDPVLYPSQVLALVDPTIPIGWIMVEYREGDCFDVSIGPPEFLVRGFWEEVHDGDNAAMNMYRSVLKRYGLSE